MAHRTESAHPEESRIIACVDKAYLTSKRKLSLDVTLDDAIATKRRKGRIVNARDCASSILTPQKHAGLVATVSACRSSGSSPPTPPLYTPPATVLFQTPVRGGKSPAPPDDVVITPARSAAPVSERELNSAFAEGVAMMRKDELDLSALNPVLKAIAQDTRADFIVGGSFVASAFAEVVPNSFTLPYNDIDVYKGGFDTTVEYQRVGYSTKDLDLPAPVQYIDCVGLDMSRLAKGVDLNLVDGRFM